jgi:hypothetical protein
MTRPQELWARGTFEIVAKAARKIWRFPDEYLRWMRMPRGPFEVHFTVELIPIRNQPRDPWGEIPGEQKKWDRLISELKKDPFVESAMWESLNPAETAVIIKPRLIA